MYLGYQRRDVISFEHAWFLRRVLAERVELCLDSCERCESPFVCDPLTLEQRGCPLCIAKNLPSAPSEANAYSSNEVGP